MEKRGTRQDKPMKPQVVAWELGKRLEENAIVSSDSGTVTTWWVRQIQAKRGQKYSLSGTLAKQMVFLGNPEFGCDLAPIDFAKDRVKEMV